MHKDEEVTVTTAIALSEEDRTNLRQRLVRIFGITTLDIKYKVDPGIIAGIIIQTTEKIIDNSVMTKLRELRLKLTGYSNEQVNNSEHP